MITVAWRPSENSYIVEQDEAFIHDSEFLYEAIAFALAVGDANSEMVEVVSIRPKS